MNADSRVSASVSDAELQRRWVAARAIMDEHQVDTFLAQASNDWLGGNVKWLTDIPANNGYPRTVLFHRHEPMTVVEMGVFGGVREFAGKDAVHRGVGRILTTPSFPSVHYTIAYDADLSIAELRRLGARRVGLMTPGGFLAGFMDRLRLGAPEIAWVDLTDALDAVKAVKSAEERELARATACLQDKTFAEVCNFIQPGMCDVDVTSHAQQVAQRLGSEQGILLGASARIGIRSPFLGRHFQNRVLQPGDHLSLLIEVNGPGGIYTEIGRTLCLGKASEELKAGFAKVKAAQEYTLSLLKPGAAPAAIAAAHDAYMRDRGLPPETRLYAHAQGYDMVERPLIRRDETLPIAEHMNFAVHPGFETEAIFAVICDNYLIEADGPGACLHSTEKKIFEL